MLEQLKREVYQANMMLREYGLVILTWGNVSGIDRDRELVVIKPSGVDYDKLSPENMAVVDMDGAVVEGSFKPSSDTATHLELYRAFPEIGGVTHTHSTWAVIFAQAGRALPPCGTTHADYFGAEVPCTRKMTPAEIADHYEKNTGVVIAETFRSEHDYQISPGVFVHSHGPFTWGGTPAKAVENSIVLEEISKMGYHTEMLGGSRMQEELLHKHYFRKHGRNAYYGQ